ncbi:MAG: MoaD/ThiS family protein [Pseudomonadota bacterium]
MQLRLLYFAWVREALGKNEEVRDFPSGVTTIADVLSALSQDDERYAGAFAAPERLRFALDQVYAGPETPIRDGAELGIFPPVTGG